MKDLDMLTPLEITLKGNWGTKDVTLDGETLSPRLSQKVLTHSPDGFNWGYGGSGPCQLSLAILLQYFPVQFALDHYMNFRDVFISGLPQEDFEKAILLREWFVKVTKREEIVMDNGTRILDGIWFSVMLFDTTISYGFVLTQNSINKYCVYGGLGFPGNSTTEEEDSERIARFGDTIPFHVGRALFPRIEKREE